MDMDPIPSPTISAPMLLPSRHNLPSSASSDPTQAGCPRSPPLSSNLQPEDSDTADAALRMASEHIWAGRTRAHAAAVDDDANEVEDELDGQTADGSGEEEYEYEYEWGTENYDSDKFTAISVWDELSELFQQKGRVSGASTDGGICLDFDSMLGAAEDITDDDLAHLRPFALKVDTHMPGKTFTKLKFAFPDANVDTWKKIQGRVAHLSGVQPELYDCCVKSCLCYVGPHARLRECPHCHESRFRPSGQPRACFMYIPFTPRLKALQANKTSAQSMQHRATGHQRKEGVISDVMDSTHYQGLLGQRVVVNGKQLPHNYFEDPRDVALGLSTDGFAPHRRRKKTAWPVILFNYNLPPEIRFHLEHIIPLGVIPGPKKPVDFDSFMWPALQEFVRLAVGVHAYDALTDAYYALRAFLILVFGDILAISMVMRMKGHNGFTPCRICNIHGIRVPGSRQPTLYVPLDRTHHPDAGSSDLSPISYDPLALPLRTHPEYLEQAHSAQFAPTETEYNRLSRLHGIKGIPALSVLSSLSFPSSFPYDFMHLIFENVLKNLMLLWTGTYKGLDMGTEEYQIAPTVWDAIGAVSAESGDTIPSSFGPRPLNVANDKTSWTADSRSFWSLYIPVVLRNRFVHRRYYDHFVRFVKLINICLQFEITDEEVMQLQTGFADWVQEYERCVMLTAGIATVKHHHELTHRSLGCTTNMSRHACQHVL